MVQKIMYIIIFFTLLTNGPYLT